MPRRTRNLLVALPGAVWFLAVAIPFFRLNAAAFRPLLESMAALGSALWFWLLALALGWRTLRAVHFLSADPTDLRSSGARLVLAAGAGLGLLAALTLLVGMTAGVGQEITLGLLVLIILMIGPAWKESGLELCRFFGGLSARNWKPAEILGMVLILGIAALQLPAALTPSVYPDTLRYHFGLTRLFLQEGCIRFLPDFAEANISSNWQMIYLPQLILSGDGCAQVFNWLTLPMTVAAVFFAAERRAAFPAAITLVSTPFLLEVSGLGNNDLGVTFFAACMWLALLSPATRRPALLAGLFGGFAVGTKYPALLFVAATFVAWFFIHRSALSNRSLFQRLAGFAAGIFAGYLPWFIRNLAWTGDPFYPVLSRWLPWVGSAGRRVAEHYGREMAAYGSGLAGWERICTAPWRMTVADARHFESDIGLIFWCAAPLVIWMSIRSFRTPAGGSGRVGFPALATLIGGTIWACGPQVTRFLAPLLPAAALAVGGSWREWMLRLDAETPSDGRTAAPGRATVKSGLAVVALALVCVNIWQALTSIAGFSKPYDFLLQAMTREQYLARYNAPFRLAGWLRRHDLGDRRIVLLGIDEVFWFQNPVRVSGPFDAKWIVQAVASAPSAGVLAERLNKAGVELLGIDRDKMNVLDQKFGYLDWPDSEAPRHFEQFLQTECETIFKDGSITLYRLRSSRRGAVAH